MPYAEDNVAVCFATVCSAARSLPLGSPVPQMPSSPSSAFPVENLWQTTYGEWSSAIKKRDWTHTCSCHVVMTQDIFVFLEKHAFAEHTSYLILKTQ